MTQPFSMHRVVLKFAIGFLFMAVPFLSYAATATISVTPNSSPFYAGGTATVTWSSTGAFRCVGTNFSTGNATSGSATVTVYPAGTKTYSVSCYDDTPACSLVSTGSFTEDAPGQNNCNTNINYSPSNSCYPAGATCMSSVKKGTSTWTITQFQCQGSCSMATKSASVTANTPPPPPTPSVMLSVTPTIVTAGSSVSISWTATRATNCVGTNFATGGNVSGSVTKTPTANTTYSISCDSEVYSSTPGVWVDTGVTDVTDLWCTQGPPQPNYSNYYTNNACTNGNPTGQACTGSETCAVNSWSNGGNGGAGGGGAWYCNLISDIYRCNGGSAPNQITDTATVVYNRAPNAPTITGPTTGVPSTNYTFSFKASDPDSNSVRYRIDWNNDGVVDVNLPSSGYTTSNTLLSSLYQWATSGTYTFKARTQDSPGAAQSGWTTYSITIGNPTPLCADGIDNDGDGLVDLADYGCTDGNDTTESPNPQCSDGIDNDGDGSSDYPADFGCTSLADTTESPNPQCSDGIDNNGNGLIDLLDIGACTGPSDGNEESLPDGTATLTSPTLVQPNSSAILVWTTNNVSSGQCVITGSNGEVSGALAGTSGAYVSSALTQEATFTLACVDLNLENVIDVKTVKIAPSFNEI